MDSQYFTLSLHRGQLHILSVTYFFFYTHLAAKHYRHHYPSHWEFPRITLHKASHSLHWLAFVPQCVHVLKYDPHEWVSQQDTAQSITLHKSRSHSLLSKPASCRLGFKCNRRDLISRHFDSWNRRHIAWLRLWVRQHLISALNGLQMKTPTEWISYLTVGNAKHFGTKWLKVFVGSVPSRDL